MPKYTITRGFDAYSYWTAEVEAPDLKTAMKLARDGDLHTIRHIPCSDHYDAVEEINSRQTPDQWRHLMPELTMKQALDQLKQNMSHMQETAVLLAELKRVFFKALVNEGFTEAQAIELTKNYPF